MPPDGLSSLPGFRAPPADEPEGPEDSPIATACRGSVSGDDIARPVGASVSCSKIKLLNT